MKNLAVIPARGNSKRIPKKAIVDFFNKPIISYPVNALKQSCLFDEIHISTDDDEIRDVAISLNLPPAFARTVDLADDHTPVLEVLKWVVNEYKKRGKTFDNVCMVMPCSPFLVSNDFIKAFEIYKSHSGNLPLLSVCPFPTPPEWALEDIGDNIIEFKDMINIKKRAQDLKKAYFDTGNFSIFSSNYLQSINDQIATRFIKYELPPERSIDIDTFDDLIFAKKMYKFLMDLQ